MVVAKEIQGKGIGYNRPVPYGLGKETRFGAPNLIAYNPWLEENGFDTIWSQKYGSLTKEEQLDLSRRFEIESQIKALRMGNADRG